MHTLYRLNWGERGPRCHPLWVSTCTDSSVCVYTCMCVCVCVCVCVRVCVSEREVGGGQIQIVISTSVSAIDTSVSSFLVSSVIIFIAGFLCGLCLSRKFRGCIPSFKNHPSAIANSPAPICMKLWYPLYIIISTGNRNRMLDWKRVWPTCS